MHNYKQRHLRALVVDDSHVNLEITSDLIQDLGFKVDTACNGQQALEAVNQHQYSLICMDIRMPDMDYLNASKAIREYELAHNLPPVIIIALTSETTDTVKQCCMLAGMNDCLYKPYSQDQISNKISYWLDDGRSPYHQHFSTVPAYIQKSTYPNADDVSQISHWTWDFSNQRFEYSQTLQQHYSFPLEEIKTLNQYILRVSRKHLLILINKCLNTRLETRWEQVINTREMRHPKHILHRFRVIKNKNDQLILIGTVQDVSYLRRVEQKVIKLCSLDHVTGLSSRFIFKQQLDSLTKDSQHNSAKFILLHLNLGIFNQSNIDLSQKQKNEILSESTKRIQSVTPGTSIVSHMLDDNFCIAIKNVSNEFTALKHTAAYLKLFSKPITLAEKQVTPNINIGIASYPDHGESSTTLINAAAFALKQAQSNYSNQYCYFSNKLHKQPAHKLISEDELAAARDSNQLTLYYQPKVSLNNQSIDSLDVSIQWHHPAHGTLSFSDFLPLAEHHRLISDIESWVIQEACKQISNWRSQGLEDISVTIHISEQHFEQPDFVYNTLKITTDADIPSHLIEIEINEHVTRQQEVYLNTCEHLRSLGFKISVDGFAAGYSSLSTLKQSPIDTLRIEKEFIQHIPNDTQSSIILGAILGLSNELGLEVVATGIENKEQLLTLTAIGCHYAQGNYFSSPMTADNVVDFIKSNTFTPSGHANNQP